MHRHCISDSAPAAELDFSGLGFSDPRLRRRFHAVAGGLGSRLGASIPYACQDWPAVKAAYRFLSNPRVSESEILAGHFQATRQRLPAGGEPILILHDTTEFSYKRTHTEPIGHTRIVVHRAGHGGTGPPLEHTVCGILMHSSLVLTTAGVPLGLCAVKFWARKKFKHTDALRGKICASRIPIEAKESLRWPDGVRAATRQMGQSGRCVHIGDRESDIFELFCAAQAEGTHFLVRTCVDRLAGDGSTTIARVMARVPVGAEHRIEVRGEDGRVRQARLALRWRRMVVCAPIDKDKRYPKLTLTVLHACERRPPPGQPPIHWKLLTDLPVSSPAQAIEKLGWYAQRWKIETYHKILKSGCRAEESRLRTADRLLNLLALFCILSWRIFWMTMLSRAEPEAPARLVFTSAELRLLQRPAQPAGAPLRDYIRSLARLGGYLARSGDPPPGNLVVWRGLSRLAAMTGGGTFGSATCG